MKRIYIYVLVLALCVCGSNPNKEFLEDLATRGVDISEDWFHTDAPLVGMESQITDADVCKLLEIKEENSGAIIGKFQLTDTEITDKALKCIADYPGPVEILAISNTQTTMKGLNYFYGRTEIGWLQIGEIPLEANDELFNFLVSIQPTSHIYLPDHVVCYQYVDFDRHCPFTDRLQKAGIVPDI